MARSLWVPLYSLFLSWPSVSIWVWPLLLPFLLPPGLRHCHLHTAAVISQLEVLLESLPHSSFFSKEQLAPCFWMYVRWCHSRVFRPPLAYMMLKAKPIYNKSGSWLHFQPHFFSLSSNISARWVSILFPAHIKCYLVREIFHDLQIKNMPFLPRPHLPPLSLHTFTSPAIALSWFIPLFYSFGYYRSLQLKCKMNENIS